MLKAKFVIGDTIQICLFMLMASKIEVFFSFGLYSTQGSDSA